MQIRIISLEETAYLEGKDSKGSSRCLACDLNGSLKESVLLSFPALQENMRVCDG